VTVEKKLGRIEGRELREMPRWTTKERSVRIREESGGANIRRSYFHGLMKVEGARIQVSILIPLWIAFSNSLGG
jgi:hypothetical protein